MHALDVVDLDVAGSDNVVLVCVWDELLLAHHLGRVLGRVKVAVDCLHAQRRQHKRVLVRHLELVADNRATGGKKRLVQRYILQHL